MSIVRRLPLANVMKLVTILLLLLLLLVAPAQISAQSSADGAIFKRVSPLLRQKTRVPLRLPTYLATEGETYPLSAIIEVAATGRYELQLAFTPDCSGGTACRYGVVSGQAVGRNAGRMRGRTVKLARGIVGYFIDAECAANCSDSTLSWQEGGYRYTVGIKAASVGVLRKVANSAIRPSGRD